MAYNYVKTTWVDRNVSTPNNATITKAGGGAISSGDTVTVVASPGVVTQAGTSLTAARLNNIEEGIEKANNPEYSTTQVSTSDINSLPSTSQGLMDSMVVKGRTVTNLFSNAVAGCESTSGWGTQNSSVATDSNNELEGTNCLKVTISSTSGSIYIDILNQLVAGRYYLVFGYFKNATLSTGMRLGLNVVGDLGVAYSSAVGGATYEKRGLILQPSDFNSATNAYLICEGVGANTQYGFVDGLALIEISATEYALGVDALLAKYSFHLGTKSADKLRVKTTGKNLFHSITQETISVTTGLASSSTTEVATNYSQVNPSTAYFASVVSPYRMLRFFEYDINKNFLGYTLYGSTVGTTITTKANTKFIRCTFDKSGATLSSVDFANLENGIQLELGIVATSYEPYKPLSATNPIELKAVSDTITDTWDCLNGKVTKNCSDWVTLSGNAFSWVFNSDNASSFKSIYVANSNFANIKAGDYYYPKVIKYNNMQLKAGILTETEQAVTNVTNTFLTVSDSDTGWLDAWEIATSFTGMTWANLIKAYMNGWKLTTANTNVASCVWTGITSGTTQSGSSGYNHVIANIDSGFTPYKMIYQLATPVTTYLQPSTLLASASGTIQQDRFIEDYAFYNSGLALTNASYLIESLVEVRKWNIEDGSYTIISNTNVTVTAGVITAIVGASAGDFYTFDYNYSPYLAINGELNFSYPVNVGGQVEANTKAIVRLEDRVENVEAIIPKTKQVWEEIANYTVSGSAISQIDFEDLDLEFVEFELIVKGKSSTTSQIDLGVRFNSDSGNNYNTAVYKPSGTNIYGASSQSRIVLSRTLQASNISDITFASVKINNIETQKKCIYGIGTTGADLYSDAGLSFFGNWTNTSNKITTIS